ncbi:hypothetical protein [Paenibacillus sp. LHD-38]|uniref:hypothetical protein n=1 Tax=Paenibacillus sp. LHD-38 TaxID=3072143 RepID=UPI00280E2A35|nr:hypothetical protein [Paenibacillus sp. LHD-38]MDQ8738734.1 hypothetical protein [Paenibacillus sp. LHD-38]
MVSPILVNSVLLNPSDIAWRNIISELVHVFSEPYTDAPTQEVLRREKFVSELETLVSGASWDLWNSFTQAVPKTSELLKEFWGSQQNGKAIFIIDGLSLREMPYLLQEARERGFYINGARVSGSELPSETTTFAKSIGFTQRSLLENNRTSSEHVLPNATTQSVDLPWIDCVGLIRSEPNWIMWHSCFDDLIHLYSEPGKGLRDLFTKGEQHFTSDDFWKLVNKLATGRRVVITSDHGYAATGEYANVNEEQTEYLRAIYKSQRFSKSDGVGSQWIPPIDVHLDSDHGSFRYVLGRRKWKSSGGYPTLAHGGLSFMETFVPFIELSL